VALGLVTLAGTMALTGCAKDVHGIGSGGSGTGSGGGGGANTNQGCKLADKPPLVGGGPTTSAAAPKKVDASKLKVGMAYDIGGRGDASFNDAAYAGLAKSQKEMGVKTVKEVTAQANETEDARRSRLRQLASAGFNPVITVGFSYADSVKAVAPQFPKTQFAIVDDDTVDLPNVTPLVFAEEQGSFLVGVAAAYKSKSCNVGFVGGVQTPLIQKFEAGFIQGAKAAAPNITIQDSYIKPAGDNSGFNDPADGNTKTQGELQQGADVVYHAAGASGKGVFDAVKQQGKLAIGVDSDQYNQKTVADDKDVIMTSMIKRVDIAVYSYIAAIASNTVKSLPTRFDLKTGAVGYATSGGKIDDIKGVLEAYKAEIIDGKIKVADKPSK
jgi:basic membrane protein A